MVISPSEVELCNPPSKGREISGDIAQTNRLASAAAAAAAAASAASAAARKGQVGVKKIHGRGFFSLPPAERTHPIYSLRRGGEDKKCSSSAIASSRKCKCVCCTEGIISPRLSRRGHFSTPRYCTYSSTAKGRVCDDCAPPPSISSSPEAQTQMGL